MYSSPTQLRDAALKNTRRRGCYFPASTSCSSCFYTQPWSRCFEEYPEPELLLSSFATQLWSLCYDDYPEPYILEPRLNLASCILLLHAAVEPKPALCLPADSCSSSFNTQLNVCQTVCPDCTSLVIFVLLLA